MINFPRSCFCVVAMLLRQYSGGRIIGFVALLHALSGLLIYTGVLLFLRGFLTGTSVGSLLAVPIAVPMLLFIALIIGVWLGRSFGWLRYAGPMRLIGPNDGFTGHAGEIIRRRFNVEHEWTLLERYEPAVLSAAGVVLCILPWTRAIGFYVVLMAIAAAWQSTRDRRVNVWQQADPEEEFAQPFGEAIAAGNGVEIAFDALGDVSVLLDEDALRQAKAQTGTVREEPRSFISVAPGVAFKPRGPISVHRKPRVTPWVMGVIGLIIANFAAGDLVRLYDRAPARWLAGVHSLQSAGSLFGPATSSPEQAEGGLTRSFMDAVDPDAARRLQESKVRDAIASAMVRLGEAEAALERVHLAFIDRLGTPISSETRPEDFDRLLVTQPVAAEALAAIRNGVETIAISIADVRFALQQAERSPGSTTVERVKLIEQEAQSLWRQTGPLHTHIGTLAQLLDHQRARNRPTPEDAAPTGGRP